ncbi:MAG: tetratricopeptide repeat protein [Candidatus Omnitrophota bacterium]
MNKYLKLIFIALIVIFSLLLLSPFISLILPQKLTNRTYFRLLYHAIVDKETSGVFTEDEKVLNLFNYVVSHEFAQGTPYKCKPAESLIYAEAYCDFQARTLNALLGIAGIKSRYAMLLDKDGISPHTLNEVFIDGKWCVFDTTMNIIFTDDKGNKVTLEQMSADPGLIVNNKKLIALKGYRIEEYENLLNLYSRMFPLPVQPRRSTPNVYQVHIFDRISDLYFKVFKYNFFNFYQDLYLKLKTVNFTKEDARLFFLARNYHLAYRMNLAQNYYNRLLEKYPNSILAEDAIFFYGMFNFKNKNYNKAADFFNIILARYPGKWKSASYYYLGMFYKQTADKKEGFSAFYNTDINKLDAEEIEEYNKNKF